MTKPRTPSIVGRLPHPARDDLAGEARDVYDLIVDGPRASGPFALTDDHGRLHGPFNAMLVNPALGSAVQQLGARIRYGSSLADREREIAILALAVERDSDFEWYAHERVGLRVGLEPAELDELDAQGVPSTFTERERTVLMATRALVVGRDLDDLLFDQAREQLGLATLADLVVLVGYYDLLALSLRVWRTPLPDGETRRP